MSSVRNRRGKEETGEDPAPKTVEDPPEAEGAAGEPPAPPPRGPGPAGQRQQERVTLVFDRSATHIPEDAREQVGDVWVFNPNKVTVQFKLLTTHPDAVFLFPKNQTLGPRSAMVIKAILTDRDVIEKLPANEPSKVLVEWRVLAREKKGMHDGPVSSAVFRFAFDVLTTAEREGEAELRAERWRDRGLPSPLRDVGLEYKEKKRAVDSDDEFEEKEAKLGLLREGLNTEMKQIGRRLDALKRELAAESKRYKEINYILNDRADLVEDPAGLSWFNTILLVAVFSALALTSIRLFLA